MAATGRPAAAARPAARRRRLGRGTAPRREGGGTRPSATADPGGRPCPRRRGRGAGTAARLRLRTTRASLSFSSPARAFSTPLSRLPARARFSGPAPFETTPGLAFPLGARGARNGARLGLTRPRGRSPPADRSRASATGRRRGRAGGHPLGKESEPAPTPSPPPGRAESIGRARGDGDPTRRAPPGTPRPLGRGGSLRGKAAARRRSAACGARARGRGSRPPVRHSPLFLFSLWDRLSRLSSGRTAARRRSRGRHPRGVTRDRDRHQHLAWF